MNQNNQQITISGSIKNRLEKVNSHDYWMFRKLHDNETHQKFFTRFTAAAMMKQKIEPTYQNIANFILKTFDTDEYAQAPIGSEKRQMLQYLCQLSESGINGQINKIRLMIEMKK